MPKKLRNYPIYLAPKIRGFIKLNGLPEVFDEEKQISLNPNEIDDKIVIYERQVKKWFLEPASRLLTGEDNGFLVIMICTSYIEGVQQYINGRNSRGQSSAFFKESLRRIFSLEVDNFRLEDFYSQVRCGLFHNGMSGEQVIISYSFPQAIDFSESNTININPSLMLDTIGVDFETYISQLRDITNETARNNFNNLFNVL